VARSLRGTVIRSGGDGGGKECGDLPLTHVGQAGDQPELASGKTARPQPIDAAHFEIGGLANYEPVFPLRLSLGNEVFGYQVDIVVRGAFSIWKRAA